MVFLCQPIQRQEEEGCDKENVAGDQHNALEVVGPALDGKIVDYQHAQDDSKEAERGED